jgi:hypothetical protein
MPVNACGNPTIVSNSRMFGTFALPPFASALGDPPTMVAISPSVAASTNILRISGSYRVDGCRKATPPWPSFSGPSATAALTRLAGKSFPPRPRKSAKALGQPGP